MRRWFRKHSEITRPDPSRLRRVDPTMAEGRRALRRDAQFNDYRLRAPQSLEVTPTPSLKGLVIGSCLSDHLVPRLKALKRHSIESILFNHVSQLPLLID